jgi:hypothetical protein
MEQDTRDAIESRFTGDGSAAVEMRRRLNTLLDQFRDAVLSGPDVTEHEAWRPVGDALGRQLSALAVDPNSWDVDEYGVSILVRWLEGSAEWLEESIAHRVAETQREEVKDFDGWPETQACWRKAADKVDPWIRGADPEGWPCWVRKSDGKPVPPAWIKD